MTPELRQVLEIAGLGSTLLFLTLGGLVTLMYALTTPLLYGGFTLSRGSGGATTKAAEQARLEAAAEQERQRRAVAIAAAVARARAARPAPLESDVAAWRRLHRGQRLNQPAARERARP